MIFSLIRLALPLIAIYFAVKFVKKMALKIGGSPEVLNHNVSGNDDVIEICPECGYEKGSKHRCHKS